MPANRELVTVITPTLDSRREFMAGAIKCFLSQDYPRLEMVIVRESGADMTVSRCDHGNLCTKCAQPQRRQIRYISCGGGIGAARNAACKAARGSIIVQFDDDDWQSPDRVSHQVGLLQSSGKALVAYHTVLCEEKRKVIIWDEAGKHPASQFWRWKLANPNDAWGLSYCYRRDWWERHPFPEVREREDGPFLSAAVGANAALFVDSENHMCAVNHTGNGSGRLVGGNEYQELPGDPR
jgi:glycosyltransferase involved in cell wall biosynthesis